MTQDVPLPSGPTWDQTKTPQWITPWREARPWGVRHLAGIVVLTLVYLLLSQVGLSLVTIGTNVSPLWPPTGAALAAVFLFGRKYLPGVFLGSLLAGLGTDVSAAVAAGEALANLLGTALSILALQRARFDPSLSRVKDVFSLCVGAGLLAPAPAVLVGVGSLYAGGHLTPGELTDAFRIWWIGDFVGVVGVAPLLFVFATPLRSSLPRRSKLELVSHVLLFVIVSQYVFGRSYSPELAPWLQPFILMPLAIWVALRFGTRGAALENVFLSAVAILGTASGVGVLESWPLGDAIIVSQVFLGMTTMTSLALAAIVSERQRAHERVQLLVGAVNRSQEGLVILDSKLRIVFVNPAVGEMLGYAPSELVGKRWDVAQGPLSEVESLHRAYDECRQGKSVLVSTVQYRRDGTHFDCESMITPELGPNGEPVRYICSYRDVTARNQLQARLAAQERLASVGTLAAGVAHEINNPLTYLMLNLEGLRTRLIESGGQVEAALKDALDGAERIRVIVRDLKSLTTNPNDDGTVELGGVVHGALKLAQAQLPANTRLTVELGREPVWARGSEAQLGQVVLNLLLNAVQAAPPGSIPRVTLRTRTEAEGALLEVEDEGPGIPPDVLPRIFEPFFTTKPMGSGTGLGLFVCHRIAEQLGGSVRVRSEPGRGALFQVRLPRAKPQQGAVSDRGPVHPRLRLLLVDDDVRLVQSMRMLLQEHHDVATENEPAAAESRLLQGEPFDVVLCDLQMPGISGIELHSRVARQSAELASRFIFMSGGAFTSEARQFIETTSQPVLEKPVRPDELLERLSQFWSSLQIQGTGTGAARRQ